MASKPTGPVRPSRANGALGKHGVPLADRRKAFKLARELSKSGKRPTPKQLAELSRGLSTRQIAQMNARAFNEAILQQMMREEASEVTRRRKQPGA